MVVITGAPELCVRARCLIDDLLAEGERRRMESDNRRQRNFGGTRREAANGFGNWRNVPEHDSDDEGELVQLAGGVEERRFKDGTVIRTEADGSRTIQCYVDGGPNGPNNDETDDNTGGMDCFARLRAAALSDDLGPEWQSKKFF